MYVFLTIATVIACVITGFFALLTLGGLSSIAEEYRVFDKKSRFYVLKIIFFAQLFINEIAFFAFIAEQNWSLSLPSGVSLVIMLALYFIWPWSKSYTERTEIWCVCAVHLLLLVGICASAALVQKLDQYKWENRETYVVYPVKKGVQAEKPDTVYIFHNKVISKPE